MSSGTPAPYDPGTAAAGHCRVEEALGRFSSHPRWSGYQLRIWYWIATAPLLAGLFIFGRFVASDPDAAVTMLVDYGRPLVLYGAAAAGFAAGMSLTAAITVQARRCRRIVDDAGAPQWIFITAIGAMVAIAVLMLALSLTLDLPPRVRSLVTCLGILPLVMIQSLLRVLLRTEGADGRPVTGAFRPWTVILPALPVAFVLASQVEAVSRWLASFDFIERMIQVVGGGVPGVDADQVRRWVVTVVVGVVASPVLVGATSMMMRLWRGAADDGAGRDAPTPEPAVYPLLGEQRPTAATAAIDDTDPDVESGSGIGILRQQFSTDPIVVSLLGGRSPLAGQSEHMHAILERARRSRQENPDAPTWERASTDTIIEADAGSGRTTAVVAAIVRGILCEGDHALFLVPEAAAVGGLVEQVKDAMAAIGLDALLGVETLSTEAVARWMGPTSPAASPAVIVGTPQEFERAFFEGITAPDRRRQALREIGVVVVEDLDRFGFDDLVHLPQILSKLRLFLAATGDSCRTVIVTLPLTRAGRALVHGRLCDARRVADGGEGGRGIGAGEQKAPARLVPFSSRAATPLFVQHLCSLARLLPRRHPIHRSWWAACGLPEDEKLRSAALARAGDGMEILTDRDVVLDPPLIGRVGSEGGVSGEGSAEAWPWAIVDGSEPTPRPLPVGIREPIDRGAGFLLDEDGARLTPVISIPARDTRVAEIKDQAMVLGRIDLAYTTRLLWRSLGTDYSFRRILQVGHATTIEATPRGAGARGADRSILDVPRIDWPEPVAAEDLGLSSGPCRGRITMYSLGAGAAPVPTHWTFTGRYDDQGLVVPVTPPVGYACDASVVAILFDQPGNRQTVEAVCGDVMDAWRRVGDASADAHFPELGAAVAVALAAVAPGLERFARCVGLRLAGDHGDRPRCAVLLVEPLTTAGSVRECLLEMLMDEESVKRFLEELERAIDSGSSGRAVPLVHADYAIAPRVADSRIVADAATVGLVKALASGLATWVEERSRG